MEAGQQLLHYRLFEKIGEGGMGVVWKASDERLHRHLAIKVLPVELTQDPDRVARFHHEARLSAWVGQIYFTAHPLGSFDRSYQPA